jgi:hypothetical protein
VASRICGTLRACAASLLSMPQLCCLQHKDRT